MTSVESVLGTQGSSTINGAAESIHKIVFSPRLDLAAVEEVIKRDPAALNTVNPENALTPIQAAARRGHSGLLRLLGTNGADLEVRSRTGETPFLMACQVCGMECSHGTYNGMDYSRGRFCNGMECSHAMWYGMYPWYISVVVWNVAVAHFCNSMECSHGAFLYWHGM